VMDAVERERLAQRLSTLSLKDARREMRRLDPGAELTIFRNSMWGEYHTVFVLPTVSVKVILVERVDLKQMDLPEYSGPRGARKRQAVEYSYIEARVQSLNRSLP
jgi:hypothetical protein